MNEHVILGARNKWGEEVPFSIHGADRLRHMYILGQTGVGKSTLVKNLIVQDIAAGHGVAFFDPHGDKAWEILDFVPPHRIDDVVYFDPSDSEFPIGFNLVGSIPRAKRHLLVSGIVAAFRGIWANSWGPRSEFILSAAVAALLDCENVSLLSLPKMLTDDAYRAWVVRQVKDPQVHSIWKDQIPQMGRAWFQEATAPLLNKVNQLLMSPQVRNVLGQVRSRLDARHMMDRGKIFIANLSKGRIGEDKANLIGALWITMFQVAAASRADIPEDERRPFHIYVDEFQSFITESFEHIFSEMRKYGLSLTVAHQFLGQVDPKVIKSVFGTVGSMIVFRLGHEDAEQIQRTFGDTCVASEFTSLGNGEVYARVLADGKVVDPFLGSTYRTCGRSYGRREQIIERSRMRYSTKRSKVEAKIDGWFRRWRGLSPGRRVGR